MSTLIDDTEKYAEWIANALSKSGYDADFSIASLKEIDRFFDDNSDGGKAIPGGFLSQDLGARIFALGSYLGEVIRGTYGGEWFADDDDPEGEKNVQIRLSDGGVIWPVHRVMNRFRNGQEDSVYVLGVFIGESLGATGLPRSPATDQK